MSQSRKKTIRNKRTLSEKVEISIFSLLFISISLICLLALTYLSHTNKISTKTYQLMQLKKEREALITEGELLNIKISKVQSLGLIEDDPVIANMHTYDTPVFIRGDTAVASNEYSNPFYN